MGNRTHRYKGIVFGFKSRLVAQYVRNYDKDFRGTELIDAAVLFLFLKTF